MTRFEPEISQPPRKVKVVPKLAASMELQQDNVSSEKEALAQNSRDLKQIYYLERHLFW